MSTTLYPIADAHTNRGSRDSNFGTDEIIRIKDPGGAANHHWEGWLKFDPSQLGEEVQDAILRVFTTDINDDGPNPLPGTFHLVFLEDADWEEGSITYDNQPTYADQETPDETVQVGTEDDGEFFELDITSYVESARQSGNTLTIYIFNEDSEGVRWVFATKENPDDPAPQVVVNEGVKPDPVEDEALTHFASSLHGGTNYDEDAYNQQRHHSAIASIERNGRIYQAVGFINGAGYPTVATRDDRGEGDWREWTEHAYGPSGPVDLGTVAAGNRHGVSIGIDPNGYLHMVWGVDQGSLQYRRSTDPLGSWDGSLTDNLDMLGSNEGSVSRPMFATSQSELLFTFRDGGDGNADAYLYKYDHSNEEWEAGPGLEGSQGRLLDGSSDSQSPQIDRYPSRDGDGNLHVTFTWRGSSTAGSIHHLEYARWNGSRWESMNGVELSPPLREHDATTVDDADTGSGLSDFNALCIDGQGHPHVAYLRNDGDGNVAIHHAHHDGEGWEISEVVWADEPSWPTREFDDSLFIAPPEIACFTGGRVRIYSTREGNSDSNALEQWQATEPYEAWTRSEVFTQIDLGAHEPRLDRRTLHENRDRYFFLAPWHNTQAGEQNGYVLFNTDDINSITPTDDAFVRAGRHSTNFYPTTEALRIRRAQNGDSDNDTKEAFIRFNLAAIDPSGGVTLRFRQTGADEDFQLALQALDDLTWGEGHATWDNTLGSNHDEERDPDQEFTVRSSSQGTWIERDVTDLVQEAIDNDMSILTFWLYAQNVTDSDLLITSKDNPSGRSPELLAEWQLVDIPDFDVAVESPIRVGENVSITVSGLDSARSQYERVEFFVPDPMDESVGIVIGESDEYGSFEYNEPTEEPAELRVRARAIRVDGEEKLSDNIEWLLIRQGDSYFPTDDVTVRGGGNRNQNFDGTHVSLKRGENGDDDDFTREILLRFDLTQVGSVDRAMLWLFPVDADEETEWDVAGQSLGDFDWDETTMTWNGLGLGDSHDDDRDPDFTYTEDNRAGRFRVIDITDLIAAARDAGDQSITLWLYAQNETDPGLSYASKERESAPAPELVVADTEAPALSNATASATGENEAEASVDSGEASGEIFWVATRSSQKPTAAQIKDGQDHNGLFADASGSEEVDSVGTYDFTITGLSEGTEYFVHFVQEDSGGNNSPILTTSGFTTEDLTPPTLTNPSVASVGSTTARGRVNTDEPSGTLYVVVTRSSDKPSASQITQGQDHNGGSAIWDGSEDVSEVGTIEVTAVALRAETNYWFHWTHQDGFGNRSAVVTASFTTRPSQPFDPGILPARKVSGGDYALYVTDAEPPEPDNPEYYELVGFSKEFSFTRRRDMQDTTTKDTEPFAEFEPGIISGQVDGTFIANVQGIDEAEGQHLIEKGIHAEEPDPLYWLITSNLVGSRQYYGVSYPARFVDKFPDEAVTEVEITLQVTGKWTTSVVE